MNIVDFEMCQGVLYAMFELTTLRGVKSLSNSNGMRTLTTINSCYYLADYILTTLTIQVLCC